ncbi:SusC/RagA family TonB-linked outer membrane protein [Chryseolinea soli]|uniref:TonB-dependent receptor n=1 Tax=Chryseolinea soli TaxID=2321403 RepID=A0A385SME3_9BACT|nr:TonB-dependent receptor [Chryseolinea soli]AYB32164.1 TonB-dependent receptor [Chryseolinea soli]
MLKFYHIFKGMLCLLILLSPGWTLAQERTITGKVTSADDNMQLPGANILVKGSSSGTVTDAEGQFSLAVGENTTLVISFVGYVSQEVAVGNQTSINISLVPDATSLAEVIVVGYGTVQKKDLTGSVTNLSQKDFNAGVNPNPLQAIQGKVAGLNITQPSGDPNQAPTVRLRGYTSLAGGSDPLYVVDGVIGVPINSISPSDIDKIDVLKDASASAIYGSRAANGVIMITTKRGKDGKPTISFNNYVAMENISKRLDLLNAGEYRDEVTRIKGPASLSDGLKFPTDANGNGYSTDWMKQITRTGYTNNHELALAGGTSQLSYRGSLNYMKREGIVKNTDFERITGRINVDQKALNDKLQVQYNLAITSVNSNLSNDDVVNRAILFLPTLPVKNTDGTYYEVPGSFDLYNPVAMQQNYQHPSHNTILVGAVNAKYEIVKGLTLGVNGALKSNQTREAQAYNVNTKAYLGNLGQVSQNFDQSNDKLMELTAQYKTNFGASNNLTVLGGYSYQGFINDGFGAMNNIGNAALADIGLYNLYGYNKLQAYQGTLVRPQGNYTSSYKNTSTLVSFFGRATANFGDKYNVTATVRRDGSTKFGANNKWGTFPSLAAGWTLSNEGFLSGGSTLNYLKLRAGWGQTGNQEGVDSYRSLLLYGQIDGTGATYYDPILKAFLPGVDITQNANPNLKWEVLEQLNLGLDFELFDGKITGTLEVYDKRTKDMLYNYTVPVNGNFYVKNQLANVGEMSNKGIELSIGGDAISSDNFRWNTRVVGSAFKNRVEKLSGAGYESGTILYNNFNGRGLGLITASQLREGHPMGEFYIPHFRGYDENGLIQYETEDGGVTTDYGSAKKFEKGSGIPKATVSWINTFTYKHFDFSFQLRGVFGNKIINNLRSNLTLSGSILENNMLRDIDQYPANYSIPGLSDQWLESGSFVRLDNWQLGYNIPVGGNAIKNARVYVAGNNLFVITKYKGIDPELQVKGDLGTDLATPNSIGMDYSNVYPKTRSFQLGVNLTF